MVINNTTNTRSKRAWDQFSVSSPESVAFPDRDGETSMPAFGVTRPVSAMEPIARRKAKPHGAVKGYTLICSALFLLKLLAPSVVAFTSPSPSLWMHGGERVRPPFRKARPLPQVSSLTRLRAISEGDVAHRQAQSRKKKQKREKTQDLQVPEALVEAFKPQQQAGPASPSKRNPLELLYSSVRDKWSPGLSVENEERTRSLGSAPAAPPPPATARIVLVAGFEAFNVQLYKQAAATLADISPSIRLTVFTDRDIASRPEVVASALAGADVFFGSLIFDYDQVNWLRTRLGHIPTRLVFESALELMSLTQVGGFAMKAAASAEGGEGGKAASAPGPPPVVKALLSKFGSQREEDRLKGYLSFLKIGPRILRMVPGRKARDIRTWLEVYAYWNQGGAANVVSLFLLLVRRFSLLGPEASRALAQPLQVKETPAQGLIHPLTPRILQSPKQYLRWYVDRAARGRVQDAMVSSPQTAPRVAVLLYRKHVITNQVYIAQLLRILEKEGLLPVPIFINGVEGHTVVRDLLTTRFEQEERRRGLRRIDSLSPEAVEVDAVINTIGFPLVGGPAGSMEAGRRVDVATRLLAAKNVPLLVAAPLLLQDLSSWRERGVLGLQSAVLYSLPELDGAVDTVVLGGLVGDKIAIVPERARKLARRILGWHQLRVTPAKEKKVSILCYGFPPNVGAIGTAALLNVPRSLEKLLIALQEQGYDTGLDARKIDGESVIAILTAINQEAVVAGGPKKMHAMVEAGTFDGGNGAAGGEMLKARITAEGILPGALRAAVGERTAARVEKMWGELEGYVGLFTSQAGELVVGGVQLGNVWIGIQPLLGIEGDPMRLLFERDLTPHPQYVAFYDWMRNSFKAQAVVHFGTHGTAEWLPGSPLGNTATTWPDILMGEIPNLYVYACNNPSESILAKRRGYGTIVSHNVPPYSRAGLYKDLAQLRELVSEYRENSEANAGLRPVIVGVLERTGLWEDCPWPSPSSPGAGGGGGEGRLTPEEAASVDPAAFNAYMGRLASYLGVLEQRLFSEGLHVLGETPSPRQVYQYLDAYFDQDLPPLLLEAIAGLPTPPAASAKSLLSDLVASCRASSPSSPPSAPLSAEGGQLSHGSGPGECGVEDVTEALLRELERGDGRPVTHWYNSLSNEEKYAMTLYRPNDLLRFYSLRLRRAWGDREAKARLEEEVAVGWGTMEEIAEAPSENVKEGLRERVVEAIEIKKMLEQNTEELASLVKGLNGEYVLPGVGGDLLRDGLGVLPTGRNIHALDPYRLPSPGAWARGQEAVRKILAQHQAADGGYPETVAVMLWGLDAIKTRGESVAILLALVGARPVKEATGRVVRYELVPLAELGRPRIDVLASLSGIFRDSFSNVVDLLDDLFERAATAEGESEDMNYIKKHANKLKEQGEDRPTARLFSNPAGDYGSLVNERVGNGEWEQEEELGETWASRNAYSFGKGERENGVKRDGVLKELLGTTERIVQEIDSVEYGLSDIQEYYANTGALKKAAENIANAPDRSGKNTAAPPRAQPAPSQGRADSDQQGGKGEEKKKRVVKVSIVEAFTKDVAPQELEATLRLEYRSKLLNPKWAEAMAAQGSGGAYEISQRMTALVGWSSTAGFRDQWVYDGAVERYVLDEKMAQKLMDNNPEAMRNVVKRMLEAIGRGYWETTPEVLEHLREMYAAAEDEIELSGGKGVRKKVLREDGGEKSAPTPREEVKVVSAMMKNLKEERAPVVSR